MIAWMLVEYLYSSLVKSVGIDPDFYRKEMYTDLAKHADAQFVIYFLIDEIQKQVYIGSAERLGDRVRVGRPEIPGWNHFRYEIVHPDYHHLLRRIEHNSIGSFARFFKNSGNVASKLVSDYELVNKNWSKAK